MSERMKLAIRGPIVTALSGTVMLFAAMEYFGIRNNPSIQAGAYVASALTLLSIFFVGLLVFAFGIEMILSDSK